MLVIFNDSPKNRSKLVRGIVGRYCWKISRDLWIWPKKSIKDDIIESFKKSNQDIRVLFLYKDTTNVHGFRVEIY